jgi:hypothetical protein
MGRVRGCQQEKQIDYCYQCDEFPCKRTNFDESLYKAWVRINEAIKNEGITLAFKGSRPSRLIVDVS